MAEFLGRHHSGGGAPSKGDPPDQAGTPVVPLTLGFVASIIAHTGSGYTAFVSWLRTPFAAGGVILLLIALFHHAALGLQVVIEDYVHSGAKFAAVIAI